MMKKLGTVQFTALISMTGAMKITATDRLEAHTKLHPIAIRAQNLCHRATLRLATLPAAHPLHAPLLCSVKHLVSHHCSSLHVLTSTFQIQPEQVETIDPAVISPTDVTPYTIQIAATKEDATRNHDRISVGTQIYTDGSLIDKKVGAVASLYPENGVPQMLSYHLGNADHHTVYKAEAVGLTLTAQQLLSKWDPISPIYIHIGQQSVSTKNR